MTASLYEQFVEARRIALEATDHYRTLAVNDPNRVELWQRVVSQTEIARSLLESWLLPARVASRDLEEMPL